MNGKRRYKKELKNTGPRNHKKNMCLENDTDRNSTVKGTRFATDSSKGSTNASFVSLTQPIMRICDKRKKAKQINHTKNGIRPMSHIKDRKENTNG